MRNHLFTFYTPSHEKMSYQLYVFNVSKRTVVVIKRLTRSDFYISIKIELNF